MSDDFMRHTDISWNGNVGKVEYGGGDRSMIVFFYTRPTHNPAKSAEAGRPIYEDQTFVRIAPPGERLNIVERPANQSDTRRWPMQWAQFKENKEQTAEGTPIDLLYPDQPSIGAMLKANGVHTIEQCAELSANAIESVGMGSQRYVNAAANYLKMSSKGVDAAQYRRESEEKDRQIATLVNTVETLKDTVAQLRENAGQTVDLNQVKALIAAQQGRPTYPVGRQLDPVFDPQTAQINAVHHTADIVKERVRKRSRSKI